LDPESIGFSIG